ncbi:hypothetical protein ES332_D02G075100v1 [Gossypium tomentosum]|uniref:Uncharacterized protein n=1 Tax=Gossypium tomentosum TaxID=34277 RepID=A0A5D2LUA2_GOSTO|nr:hypothetical protein ES332_D02G075100v1 [Gossypium tomentosum]
MFLPSSFRTTVVSISLKDSWNPIRKIYCRNPLIVDLLISPSRNSRSSSSPMPEFVIAVLAILPVPIPISLSFHDRFGVGLGSTIISVFASPLVSSFLVFLSTSS